MRSQRRSWGGRGPSSKCEPTSALAAGALSLAWRGAAHHLPSAEGSARRRPPRAATLGSIPCRTREDCASPAPAARAGPGPRPPPSSSGAPPPPRHTARPTASRVSPPARSSGLRSQRLSSALSRPPAAPWSGCVFSAHHHVHQLVARVQHPQWPEGAAPAAAAAAAGRGDRQRAAVGGEQPPLETPDARGAAAAGRIPRRGGP